mmetsp:Transcript_115888/g.188804  ORF Transcript_115888/g.188804 Transcript_115888/m.188804 type:complete len:93 (-) Transcript_115888:16-294(-)
MSSGHESNCENISKLHPVAKLKVCGAVADIERPEVSINPSSNTVQTRLHGWKEFKHTCKLHAGKKKPPTSFDKEREYRKADMNTKACNKKNV